jgi:hypothetical protein
MSDDANPLPEVETSYFGPAVYGAYRPGRSDHGAQVVTTDALAHDDAAELARQFVHLVFPCPARRGATASRSQTIVRRRGPPRLTVVPRARRHHTHHSGSALAHRSLSRAR